MGTWRLVQPVLVSLRTASRGHCHRGSLTTQTWGRRPRGAFHGLSHSEGSSGKVSELAPVRAWEGQGILLGTHRVNEEGLRQNSKLSSYLTGLLFGLFTISPQANLVDLIMGFCKNPTSELASTGLTLHFPSAFCQTSYPVQWGKKKK